MLKAAHAVHKHIVTLFYDKTDVERINIRIHMTSHTYRRSVQRCWTELLCRAAVQSSCTELLRSAIQTRMASHSHRAVVFSVYTNTYTTTHGKSLSQSCRAQCLYKPHMASSYSPRAGVQSCCTKLSCSVLVGGGS